MQRVGGIGCACRNYLSILQVPMKAEDAQLTGRRACDASAHVGAGAAALCCLLVLLRSAHPKRTLEG